MDTEATAARPRGHGAGGALRGVRHDPLMGACPQCALARPKCGCSHATPRQVRSVATETNRASGHLKRALQPWLLAPTGQKAQPG